MLYDARCIFLDKVIRQTPTHRLTNRGVKGELVQIERW